MAQQEFAGIDAAELTEYTRRRQWPLLLAGALKPAGSGRVYENVSPVTGEVIAEVPDADGDDVHAAVQAGTAAFPAWAATSVSERVAIVRKIAARLREHAAELGALDTLDGGNIIRLSTADVMAGAAMLDYFADLGQALKGETSPLSPHAVHYTTPQPIGVVARIIPYNHPIMFAAGKIAAPLIAGNCVVLKPPHQTPLSALRLGELTVDLLPPGVLSILPGAGPATGEAIVRHPQIRRVAFIGSAATGLAIQRAAAETSVKHVTLELGGKNALVAFADADPVRVAAAAVRGMNFSWSGQSCGSTSRLVVHEDIREQTVAEIMRLIDGLSLGSPFDERTDVGALVSEQQFAKAMSYVDTAREEGARLVTGGEAFHPQGWDRALIVRPTVFTEVDTAMRIAQEEVFGPVLSVLSFHDEAEAVRIANSTEYGLTAAVWTNDLRRAHRVAAALEAGYVWINDSSRHFVGAPFGGVKSSGLGREECVEELLSFTETKAVHLSYQD
ncbi:aldehyde dehydrogenase family protein [Saccharopolyspora phatthalungensis]|uniref:Acyl-CoA reductase-like NAD-dependent aldehyde dehydrogenase n=1 Tax=Saccharopolyspora phatthalungensis TaxID=664693 RepID=A0A840QBM4_9PSEU|nr:aldehyde dehydrogenase family protein [Saccharopolyspora phatthalungensis]MBB5157201.1 acyl-CoA reductase-like NAD-dependent aldehyde dehydrogenase [Saccharopolyspora phatthalungensis]